VAITTVKPASNPKVSLNQVTGEVTVMAGTQAGTYTITYRICDKGLASNCDEAVVTVNVSPPPVKAANDTGIPVSGWQGGIAVADVLSNDLLNGKAANPAEVKVTVVVPAGDPGITLDPNTGRVVVGYMTPPGNYEITYRICEVLNPGNCSEAKVTVAVTDDCEVVVPNTFSPNGDGIQDYWRVKCLQKYPDAKVEIFNRWGNKVYEQGHYGNSDVWGEADSWWDGRSNQKWTVGPQKLPPGTYYYILHFNKGTEKPKAGFLFLNY